MCKKSYERECISRFMSTSDVLKVLKIARAVGKCNLRTFKTSRVTINPEMHEQVHTIFYLLYIQQNYSVTHVFDCELFVLVFFSIFRPCLPYMQPGLCNFQRVFFSRFLQVSQLCFCLTKQTDCQPFSFSFRAETWHFPSVSTPTSVLHSITSIFTL